MSEGSIKGIVDNYDTFNNCLLNCANKIVGVDIWSQISVGRCSSTAIKTDGTLWTWGANDTNGTLGNGTTVSRCSPGTIAGVDNIKWCQISGIYRSVMALKTDGTFWSWGRNDIGQLGDGTTVARCSPGTIWGGGTTWCQTSNGLFFSAAIKTDGTLWTWGSNARRQLGDGTSIDRCSPGTVWGSYTTWCEVATGGFHIAAIKTDGTLWTWGYGTSGQLGSGGVPTDRCSPGTVAGGGTTWCQVDGGRSHTVAIKTDGTLWTWGKNSNAELGDGTTVNRCSPGTTAGCGTNWCQVSTQYSHTSAIKTNGTIWTWGCNGQGRLGDGTTVNRCSPGTVVGVGTNWSKVSNGQYHTVAIKCNSSLWSWGSNGGGTLGDGTTINNCSPVSILPSSSAQDFLLLASSIDQISEHRQVSVGSTFDLPDAESVSDGHIIFVESINAPVVSNNECWLGLDGRLLRCDAPSRTLFTWGCNSVGQLGDGTTINRCSPGTIWNNDNNWCNISTSGELNGAIKTDGTLWTWGRGALGNGTITACRSSPGTVSGSGTTWCRVAVWGNALALKTDGTLWCWGLCLTSETGGSTIISPTNIDTNSNWVDIAVSHNSNFNAAIKTDGTLWTWGTNCCGQLGNGNTTWRNSPGSVINGGTNWCQVSLGVCHGMALKTDGTLWTWGVNTGGRLGDGTTISRCSPGTTWGSYTNWCKISAGSFHSAALKTDGTLWTWGCNTTGRLGSGTTSVRCSPGTVWGSYTNWCQVSVGRYTSSAIKTDGTLWTWGYNNGGQLGDGTTVSRLSPGTVFGGGTNFCFICTSNIVLGTLKVQ